MAKRKYPNEPLKEPVLPFDATTLRIVRDHFQVLANDMAEKGKK